MASRVRVNLNIEGELFEPSKISQILGIEPTNSFVKGEICGDKKSNIHKFSCWTYSTGYRETYDSSAIFSEIMSVFDSKTKLIRNIIENYHLSVVVSFTIEIENNIVPGICFDRLSNKFFKRN
ncbi:MAG: DUF4279 domain-containing protein [Bacillus subtilis]|nr:DUF4279 domain-containing protein [Bacillus subtilis]